jgi:CheY-like chemotaxis protein
MRTPGMSGKELYGWLKDKYPQKAKKVIFSTGDVMNSETQGFLVSTGRPCLAKPFTPKELRDIANETLRNMKNDG